MIEAPAVPLVTGWPDIQADPQRAAHSRRILRGVEKYNTDAGAMVKYLAEFVTLSCAPDMLALRLFPNGKEISESFGAYDAVRYRLQQFRLDDPGVTVVCVGDGRTPRTAATFALRSKWTCISVDPMLKGGTRRWSAIKRLHLVAKRIQDVCFKADRVILVAVHSHADLTESVAAIRAKELAIVAMPCCVRMELPKAPDLKYDEKGVISPCRSVSIWRSYTAPERTEGRTPRGY